MDVLELFIVFGVDLEDLLEEFPVGEGFVAFVKGLGSFHVLLDLGQHADIDRGLF